MKPKKGKTAVDYIRTAKPLMVRKCRNCGKIISTTEYDHLRFSPMDLCCRHTSLSEPFDLNGKDRK